MSDKPRFDISKLTPGRFEYWVVDENGVRVATGLNERTARLFANAPEMAEMLREIESNDSLATDVLKTRRKAKDLLDRIEVKK